MRDIVLMVMLPALLMLTMLVIMNSTAVAFDEVVVFKRALGQPRGLIFRLVEKAKEISSRLSNLTVR